MMRHDPETYRRYAKECQHLATTMPEEHRVTLLAMAEFWIELAQKAERSNLPSNDLSRGEPAP
jgi:phytoene/squalene synthetase